MQSKLKRKVISLLLAMIMIIPIAPNQVEANVNLETGNTNPITGQGQDAWMMGIEKGDLLNAGLRISMYFGTPEEFANGTAQQLGRRQDIFPDNPRYGTQSTIQYTGIKA